MSVVCIFFNLRLKCQKMVSSNMCWYILTNFSTMKMFGFNLHTQDFSDRVYRDKVSFLKSLEPSHGVLQLLKKNFYSVLILHLLKPLFSVFHVLQALSIF